MNRGPAFLWLLNSKHRPGSLHFISLVGTTPPEAVMVPFISKLHAPFPSRGGAAILSWEGEYYILFFSCKALSDLLLLFIQWMLWGYLPLAPKAVLQANHNKPKGCCRRELFSPSSHWKHTSNLLSNLLAVSSLRRKSDIPKR